MTGGEIVELQREIPDWSLVERDGVARLERIFHPALLTEEGCLTVTWWTHKIRGLHRNDFIVAAKTDALAAARGPVTHDEVRKGNRP